MERHFVFNHWSESWDLITFQLDCSLPLSRSISWETSLHTAASSSSFGFSPSRNTEKNKRTYTCNLFYYLHLLQWQQLHYLSWFLRSQLHKYYHNSITFCPYGTCGWIHTNSRHHALHLMSVFQVHWPHVSIKIAGRIRRRVHPRTVNQRQQQRAKHIWADFFLTCWLTATQT